MAALWKFLSFQFDGDGEFSAELDPKHGDDTKLRGYSNFCNMLCSVSCLVFLATIHEPPG